MAQNFLGLYAEGDLEGVQVALLGGSDMNRREQYGRTGLMLALEGRHTAVARLLLEQEEIDINICDRLGETALHIAAWHAENSEVLSILLARPELTTVNVTGIRSGETPLWLAVSNRATPCVQVLLNDARANLNIKCGSVSPLMLAVKGNYLDGVDLLLADPRVDLMTRDDYQRSEEEVIR